MRPTEYLKYRVQTKSLDMCVQVTAPSNILQADESASVQQPSVTVVKVQRSSAEPNVRHVEVSPKACRCPGQPGPEEGASDRSHMVVFYAYPSSE